MTSAVRVRRRLLHWRPRWRGRGRDAADVDTSGFGQGGGGGSSFLDWLDDLVAAVLVVVAVVVLVMAVVPAIVLLLEVLLVGLLALLGFVGRVALGRPWTVEAVDTSTGRVLGRWSIRGFRRAGAAATAIEAHLIAGGDLPPLADVEALLARDGDPAPWPSG